MNIIELHELLRPTDFQVNCTDKIPNPFHFGRSKHVTCKRQPFGQMYRHWHLVC